MKAKILLPLLAAGICISLNAAPLPLTQSTFTEIIRDVNVVAAATKTVTPAKTNEVFRVPDLVRTGPDSRVELTAEDQTITRVGSDTVFTFERQGRNMILQSGSILFHSPAGQGGGTITSGGASASVLGTTILCVAMADGGFKTIVLEGHGMVKFHNGQSVTLNAGQMIIVYASGKFGKIQNVDLEKLVGSLLLISGFSHPLSSLPLILEAIQQQREQVANGTIKSFAPLVVVVTGLDVSRGTESLWAWQFFNYHDQTLNFISPVHGGN